jgi:N-dimethylarginine dimethylaminohydrolase
MIHVNSHNEWDPLREIFVGSATYANWPSNDPVFAKESEKTTWKESPVPSGPVPQWIIDEANEDLEGLCEILRSAGVVVHRPKEINFQERGGMYNYCPRDRLLIIGHHVVDPAMMYPCRQMEYSAYTELSPGNLYKHMPTQEGMVLDAANVCRLNDTLLFLESPSGNHAAYEWLREHFEKLAYKIEKVNFYSGVHIDSTIVPLNSDTVMINASRVRPDQVPKVFDDWRIIWIWEDNIIEQDFYQYPYASKWIGMNTLSIDPETVIVEQSQKHLIKILESAGFTVVPSPLRHSRTLGGGFHCVTLDTWREA